MSGRGPLRRALRPYRQALRAARERLHLARMRDRWQGATDCEVDFAGFRARVNSGAEYYTSYHDMLLRGIYSFRAARPDPLILDAGSNVGLSVLYFKHLYPAARIIGFEPDRELLPYLHENIRRNHLQDVQIVEAALSDSREPVLLRPQGHGSHIVDTDADGAYSVPAVPLADYLQEPVDFLKMNIEGAEWPVLAAAGQALRQVRELVIEYHHLPGLPRTLHNILGLLHELGFASTVNSFTAEANPGAQPPFRLGPQSRYFLLVYARRDADSEEGI